MLFTLYCVDRADSLDLRLATRLQHLDYVAASGAMIRAAGPLLADDGETMIGSLIVLEAANRAEAESWVRNDPYSKAGLFERVDVRAWRWSVGAPKAL